jgi:hypothetical protein
MFDPAWLSAAAETVTAVESGVSVFHKKTAERPTATPAAPTVVVRGMTGQEFLIGMIILAIAVLAAALIMHHGLIAAQP